MVGGAGAVEELGYAGSTGSKGNACGNVVDDVPVATPTIGVESAIVESRVAVEPVIAVVKAEDGFILLDGLIDEPLLQLSWIIELFQGIDELVVEGSIPFVEAHAVGAFAID